MLQNFMVLLTGAVIGGIIAYFTMPQLAPNYAHGHNHQRQYSPPPRPTEPSTSNARPRLRRCDKKSKCAICLEFLERDTTCLPCFHFYHTKCLDDLISHQIKSCPQCKQPFEV